VSERTVQSFERGQKIPHANSIAAMRRAIEEAGIRMLFDQTGKPAGIARRDTTGDLHTDAPPS
jgi:hypothetical protein